MSPGVSFSNATAAFTVQDFDWSGSVIAAHGASGSGNLIGTNYFGLGNTEWGPLPVNNPIAFTRSDGFILGADTFQGVRTYNATSAQWNTPDAYAGEVGDPMSQKPYMWNRNNPVAYSDPSGYCAPECVPEIIEGAGALLEASAALESEAIAASVIARAAPLSRASQEAADFAKSPANTNDKLRNLAEGMFRPQDELPGGTANAVRYEIATGKTIGGRFHLEKGATSIRGLRSLLKGRTLSHEERQAGNALLKDLEEAYGKYNPMRFLKNNAPPPASPQVLPGPKPQQ